MNVFRLRVKRVLIRLFYQLRSAELEIQKQQQTNGKIERRKKQTYKKTKSHVHSLFASLCCPCDGKNSIMIILRGRNMISVSLGFLCFSSCEDSLSLSVSVSVSVSVCLPVCLSVSLSLSLFLSVCLSVCLCVCLSLT